MTAIYLKDLHKDLEDAGANPCDDLICCVYACFLTGARFPSDQWPGNWTIPDDNDEDKNCAEALMAQWYGLAPVVKMPDPKDGEK